MGWGKKEKVQTPGEKEAGRQTLAGIGVQKKAQRPAPEDRFGLHAQNSPGGGGRRGGGAH